MNADWPHVQARGRPATDVRGPTPDPHLIDAEWFVEPSNVR